VQGYCSGLGRKSESICSDGEVSVGVAGAVGIVVGEGLFYGAE